MNAPSPTAPIVYGPAYSTYVRTVRLALEEKPAAYELVDVAMLQGAHQEPAFLQHNPFGKVPAFAHGGMTLYETNAITRYIDRAFPGLALQPADPVSLARMDQAISIIDSFGYGCLVGKIIWQRLVTPMLGGTPDDGAVAGAMDQARLSLAEIARILGEGPWIAGDDPSLADLHLAPIFAYLTGTPEAADLLAPHPGLPAWWSRMSGRESMARTQPQLG
jgi:glutathione S-transferase